MDLELEKSRNHQYYWIKSGELYESFKGGNGTEYSRKILDVPGMKDEEKCSDSCLKYIKAEYTQ